MTTEKIHPTTTDDGIPVASDDHSLTIGPDGPILLQDHYLIEQMANFNRERIPERQPHAKGSGAFGFFEVTNDVSAFTRAAVFAPATRTDTLIRLSRVAGERGSPDTWRDPRGFSLRFYTSEGNLDIVGNNTPVVFIRDGLKFQHFIRSQKRRADTGMRDNDMQWDFWSLSPETAHQVAWLFGDRGIPRTWRHMNGYGSHTYSWINADGEMMRAAHTLRADDGDWRQAGTLVRDVMDDAARERLVSNVVGHLRNGVSERVLQRAVDYWQSIDKQVGDQIEIAVRNGTCETIDG